MVALEDKIAGMKVSGGKPWELLAAMPPYVYVEPANAESADAAPPTTES